MFDCFRPTLKPWQVCDQGISRCRARREAKAALADCAPIQPFSRQPRSTAGYIPWSHDAQATTQEAAKLWTSRSGDHCCPNDGTEHLLASAPTLAWLLFVHADADFPRRLSGNAGFLVCTASVALKYGGHTRLRQRPAGHVQLCAAGVAQFSFRFNEPSDRRPIGFRALFRNRSTSCASCAELSSWTERCMHVGVKSGCGEKNGVVAGAGACRGSW